MSHIENASDIALDALEQVMNESRYETSEKRDPHKLFGILMEFAGVLISKATPYDFASIKAFDAFDFVFNNDWKRPRIDKIFGKV